jgi:hypothetical protein
VQQTQTDARRIGEEKKTSNILKRYVSISITYQKILSKIPKDENEKDKKNHQNHSLDGYVLQ